MSGRPERIERAVIESLICGERERFALAPHRIGAVKVALQASLQTRDAAEELRRLLQLIVAFDRHLGAPTVAEGLRNIVRADPDAVALIQSHLSSAERMDEVRRLAAEQGHAQAQRSAKILDAVVAPGVPLLPPPLPDVRERGRVDD